MKKSIMKKAITLLTAAVMVSVIAIPALAAPAQVDVIKNEGTLSTTTYLAPFDKTFEIDYSYTMRIQTVTNDNGTFVKTQVRAKGTAVDVDTGEVYRASDYMNELTKTDYDPATDTYTVWETVKFVSQGSGDNLYIVVEVTIKDGEVTKNITEFDIR